MIYFHATSNRKILLYSITNEVNQTADIAAPMPGHTSHPTSRSHHIHEEDKAIVAEATGYNVDVGDIVCDLFYLNVLVPHKWDHLANKQVCA